MQHAKSVAASLIASISFYIALTSLEIFGASTSFIMAILAFIVVLLFALVFFESRRPVKPNANDDPAQSFGPEGSELATASNLRSDSGTMRLDVSEVEIGPDVDKTSIASNNRSKGRMDVTVRGINKH